MMVKEVATNMRNVINIGTCVKSGELKIFVLNMVGRFLVKVHFLMVCHFIQIILSFPHPLPFFGLLNHHYDFSCCAAQRFVSTSTNAYFTAQEYGSGRVQRWPLTV